MLDLDILGKFLYAKFMYRKKLSIVTKNLQILWYNTKSIDNSKGKKSKYFNECG